MHDGNWIEMESPEGLKTEHNGNKINFQYDSVKPLRELKKSISKETFDRILTQLELKVNHHFETYSSKSGLQTGFIVKETIINIFSYGEKQPGRYQVIIEGQVNK